MNPHKKLAKQLKKAHATALLLDNPSASIQIEECALESCARASDYPGCIEWYEWLRHVVDARKITDALIAERERGCPCFVEGEDGLCTNCNLPGGKCSAAIGSFHVSCGCDSRCDDSCGCACHQ